MNGFDSQVNESLEKVASYGLLPNMILYLMKEYRMSLAKGTNLLFFWSAATNFMPIVGAFLADSFLGRFLAIGFGSICSFLVTLFSPPKPYLIKLNQSLKCCLLEKLMGGFGFGLNFANLGWESCWMLRMKILTCFIIWMP